MKKVIILGSGKIGSTIAYLLHQSKRYAVTLVDVSQSKNISELAFLGIKTDFGDFKDKDFLMKIMRDNDYVVNAGPYQLNKGIADVALATQTHYFDLSEDVSTTQYIQKISQNANNVFIPQCGLAPGFVSIAAQYLTQSFDELLDVKLRVGALTMHPNNRLKYNLTWSTDGLLNEYAQPCDAILDGELVKLPALENLENFTIDGVEYEAFNTSGGVGGLATQLLGKVKELTYKTIRYKGHRDLIKFLYEDLDFKNRREELRDIFNANIPYTEEDVILIYISVSGMKAGVLEQKTIVKKIYHQNIEDKHFTAIQLTTAGSVCGVIDLHAQNKLPQKGFVMQEQIPYQDYINNPFLKFYL
ncbi:MAG: saccharopine dehydrogenase NADP-binding domain-containing protein [Sphingobacteriaceae bacterium]|nr:saccharopine dehydrogenase NADP-binding domain-containing protein [Sphingobacteriaceae bacterium]